MHLLISILVFHIYLNPSISIDKSEFCAQFAEVNKIYNIGSNVIFDFGDDYITYNTESDSFVDNSVDDIFDGSRMVVVKAMASVTDRPQFKAANNLLIVVNQMSSSSFGDDSLHYLSYTNYRIDGNRVTMIVDEEIAWGLKGKGSLSSPFWQNLGPTVKMLNAFTFFSKENMFVSHCTAEDGSHFFVYKQIIEDNTAIEWTNLNTDTEVIPLSLFETGEQLYALTKHVNSGSNVILKLHVQTDHTITIILEPDLPSFLRCQPSSGDTTGDDEEWDRLHVTTAEDSKESKESNESITNKTTVIIVVIIVVIIIICLILACVVFFVLRKRNQNKKEAERSDAESNLSNEEMNLKLDSISSGNDELPDSRSETTSKENADESSLRSP